MQTVRLLERRPRTLAAKLVEMAEALGLERRLGKDDILGVYLTLAPFGGNLEGVRAASLAYFGKEPRHLSAAEAALLVALPRSPERLRPDRHPGGGAGGPRRGAGPRACPRRHLGPRTRRGASRAGPAPAARPAVPCAASGAAAARRRAVRAGAAHHDRPAPAAPGRSVAAPRGRRARRARHAGGAGRRQPHAARSLAYVGNADFASAARRGTLDMARAVRSPGSALKPFIYAMAFDRLIIHPQTVLDDRPRHFGDYAPADFDGRFHGEVSAAEALQYSLNVPAVAVLDRLGPARFIGALAAAGIRLQLPAREAEPGLAVALGGAGHVAATIWRRSMSGWPIAARWRRCARGQTSRSRPLRPRCSARLLPGTSTTSWSNAPPPPGMLPRRGAARPPARGQDRHLLRLPRRLGGRLRLRR